MRGVALLLLGMVAGLPLASAGTAEAPEIPDPAGDVSWDTAEGVPVTPDGLAQGIDVLAAWFEPGVDADGHPGFSTVLRLADLAQAAHADPAYSLAFSVWFTLAGTEHGYSTFTQGTGGHYQARLGEWQGTEAVGGGRELEVKVDVDASTVRVWVPRDALASGTALERLDPEGRAEAA